MDLAKRVYDFTRCLPRDEMYGLTSQIRRAAVSIAANTAEGQESQTTGESRQFLGTAKGSRTELETMLILARDLGYGQPESADVLLNACREVGRLLNRLLNSLATDR